jgi:serine phosphatase RsbU (regulator of sigma subunit)
MFRFLSSSSSHLNKVCLLLSLLIGFSFSIRSQEQQLKDSLETIVSNPNAPDTLRSLALSRLSRAVTGQDPNRSIQLAKVAIELSREIQFQRGEAIALISAGDIYYEMGKRKEALEYWFQSLSVFKQMATSSRSDIHSAGLHGVTDNLINISRLYCEIGELKNFEKHVAEARQIMKDNPTEYSRLGWIGIDWAGCYFSNGKYDEAQVLYNDALKSFQKAKDDFGTANTFANLGMLLNTRNRPDSAMSYLRRSLLLYKKVNSFDGQSWVHNLMGASYKRRNNTDSAAYHFNEAYKNAKEAKNTGDEISSLMNLGNLYEASNDLQKSFGYWSKAHQLAVYANSPQHIMLTSLALGKYNEATGDFKKALTFFRTHEALKDSLDGSENLRAIGKLESQYDFEKEQAMQAARYEEQLSNQRSLAEAEQKTQRYISISMLAGLVIVGVFSIFLYNRIRKVHKQKHLIALQKELVMEKNKEIMDSINYAKRIQAAVLPANSAMKKLLPESFVMYKPKDVVAGDFYWMEMKNDKILVAACDCTGHGVPGAMVSVICNNGLNRSVRELNITSPDMILNKTREIVVEEFEKSDESVSDGMDIALIALDYSKEKNSDKITLSFSGANNPVWIVRNDSNEVEVIAGDKQPIGQFENPTPYKKHERVLRKGDMVYLLTDGYKDQFGGENDNTSKTIRGKKFKASRLKKLILSIRNMRMLDQKTILEQEFEKWKGEFEQIDDVCLLGIRI